MDRPPLIGRIAAPRQRSGICLNMIVKDEAPVIGRALDSVREVIECYRIVDTGSTDGTPEAILAITTIGGLVYIHTADNEFQSDTTLNQFERRLDPSLFMRIHRSSIVNLERITKIMPWGQGRYAEVLENGNSLQVSRERIKEFRERVGLKI